MDASVFEITRVGSGTAHEGLNQLKRPNENIKQRSTCMDHKTNYRLSALTISHHNGMSTVASVVSARN